MYNVTPTEAIQYCKGLQLKSKSKAAYIQHKRWEECRINKKKQNSESIQPNNRYTSNDQGPY